MVDRAASLAIVLAVGLALALLSLAILRFPGGNDLDPTAPGFDPVRNYLSDLLHARAPSGPVNGAAPLARAAILAFVAGLPPFFLVLARLTRTPAILALGLLSSAAWVAVPLTASDAFGPWHGAAILLAVVPGLAASVTAVVLLGRGHPRLALLGGVTLGGVALTVAWYVPLLAGLSTTSIAVPVLQKASGALLVAWMLGTAAAGAGAAHGPGLTRP